MLRAVRALVTTLGTAAGVVLLGAVLESAAACEGVGVSCSPPEVDGRTVTVRVSGSLVRGGSEGNGGGSTTVSVPVPCYLQASWTGKEYYDGIMDGSITSAGWDEWGGDPDRWPYAGWDDPEIREDNIGRWYTPTCRMLDIFEDYDDFSAFSLPYFQSYPQTFVAQGETPPTPPVPPEILLMAAQEAMEVPEPAFEHNPDVAGAFDTLVNLDTWFWLSNPMQSGDVTASAGANSVTLQATLAAVTFSSPTAGAVACDGTGSAWSPGANSDCTLVFERAGTSDVTADTQWTLEWAVNGVTQGPIDPLEASFTEPVVAAESQALVTSVD